MSPEISTIPRAQESEGRIAPASSVFIPWRAFRKPAEVRIVTVETRRERKAFVTYPMDLYAECPYFVPPLIMDELATLSRGKNPAFEQADLRLFLAMDGNEVIGRIAAVVSHAANRKHGSKDLRFGWFDCINDIEVARALFGAAEAWGRSLDLDHMVGPMGFNEFDRAGLLVEGFGVISTGATAYNYPYYPELLDELGFEKDIDTVEFLAHDIAHTSLPERQMALMERVKSRWGFQVLEFKTRGDMLERGEEIFEVIEETYEDLYDHVPLTERQRAHYTKKFLPYISKDLVKAVVDRDGQIAGFFIAMPSIARALQKARGRLLPLGAYHLWKAMRPGGQTLECLLAGVRRKYRGRGVDLILVAEMLKTAKAMGFTEAESNPELETNQSVQAEWKPFPHEVRRRRRFYRKPIDLG